MHNLTCPGVAGNQAWRTRTNLADMGTFHPYNLGVSGGLTHMLPPRREGMRIGPDSGERQTCGWSRPHGLTEFNR